jgi:hypothetical protein
LIWAPHEYRSLSCFAAVPGNWSPSRSYLAPAATNRLGRSEPKTALSTTSITPDFKTDHHPIFDAGSDAPNISSGHRQAKRKSAVGDRKCHFEIRSTKGGSSFTNPLTHSPMRCQN